MEASRFQLEGQVRQMAFLRAAGGQRLIAVARNDTTLQMLRMRAR
jgi:hypothetical protein